MAKGTTKTTITLDLSQAEANALAQTLAAVTGEGEGYVYNMSVLDALHDAGARYFTRTAADYPFTDMARNIVRWIGGPRP